MNLVCILNISNRDFKLEWLKSVRSATKASGVDNSLSLDLSLRDDRYPNEN